MRYNIYKPLRTESPSDYQDIYGWLGSFFRHIATLEVGDNTYNLTGNDEQLLYGLNRMLKKDPKNHITYCVGEWVYQAHINDPNFDFALERLVENKYHTDYYFKNNPLTKVNSKEEAEQLIKEWEERRQQKTAVT